jgi:predicted esterase
VQFLREREYERVVLVGYSGGAAIDASVTAPDEIGAG